jgi:hypothetical protein
MIFKTVHLDPLHAEVVSALCSESSHKTSTQGAAVGPQWKAFLANYSKGGEFLPTGCLACLLRARPTHLTDREEFSLLHFQLT